MLAATADVADNVPERIRVLVAVTEGLVVSSEASYVVSEMLVSLTEVLLMSTEASDGVSENASPRKSSNAGIWKRILIQMIQASALEVFDAVSLRFGGALDAKGFRWL